MSEAITRNDLKAILNEVLPTADVDYVVEEGKSGIWTYRKWNSGIAECWGVYTAVLSHYYGPASGFYGYNSGSISFPTNLFNAAPTAVASGQIGSGFYLGTLMTTSTTAVQAIALSTSSGSVNCIFHFSVHGTWK